MRKIRSNAYIAIVVYVLSFLLILPIVAYISLQIPFVQKFVSDKITASLSKNLNTAVVLEKVGLTLDNKLILKNLYIEDYKLDTLFYINSLKVSIWQILKSETHLKKLEINGLKIKITEDSTGYTNLLYFLEHLPESEPKSQTSSVPTIYIEQIDIKNCDISYHKDLDSIPIGQFNPKYFRIYPLNLQINNLKINDSTINFTIFNFKFKDQESGFEIQNIAADFNITNNFLTIKDLEIIFPNSQIIIPIINLQYDSLEQLSDPQKLYINLYIDTATYISSKDLKYFIPQLQKFDFKFSFGLTLFGNTDDLTILPFYFNFGKYTKVYLTGKIIGITNPQNIYIDFEFDTIQSALSDLTLLKDSTGKSLFTLPQQAYKVNFLKAKAKITGLINDFSAFLEMNTNLGKIITNFNVVQDSGYLIQGFAKADNLNLNKLTDNQSLGLISFKDSFNLHILNPNQLYGNTYLFIDSVHLNGYTYHDIYLAADFTQDSINGELYINDPNIILTTKGYFKYAHLKRTQFSFDLKKANLYPLGFDKEDPNASISFALNAILAGYNIDDLVGTITLTRPLTYIKNLEKIELKNFEAGSKILYFVHNVPLKVVNINSDYFILTISGIFKFTELHKYAQQILSKYFPTLFPTNYNPLLANLGFNAANLMMQLQINDITPITRIFTPNIKIAPYTTIQANFIQATNQLTFQISTDSISIASTKIIKPNLFVSTEYDTLNLSMKINKLLLTNRKVEPISITSKAFNDSIITTISWNKQTDTNKNFGKIILNTSISKPDSLKIYTTVSSDIMYFSDIYWNIQKLITEIHGSKINIEAYFLNPDHKQQIGIYGAISKNPKDNLLIRIQNFDIQQLNPLLQNIKLNGYLNSNIKLSNLMDKPLILSYAVISNLKFNDVDLQTLKAQSIYDAKQNSIKFELATERIITPPNQDTIFEKYITLNGNYNLEQNKYFITINFRKFKLKAFYPYFQSVISAISRFATIEGVINIEGQNDKFKLLGDLGISHTAFKIRQTNVTYTINGKMNLHFTPNLIIIDTTTIISQDGSGKATLYGKIKHTQFNEYSYNISFEPQNLMVVNLQNTGTNSYYGKAFISGIVNFLGIGNSYSLNADIQTEPNTDLTFVLNTPKTISAQADFIRFINSNNQQTQNQKTQKQTKKSSNFDLNVNLKVTPDAKFTLLIDEQTGEALSLQGNGELNIKFTPFGDLLLFGTITIDQGDYLFSIENIVNKKFTIQSGSYIKWNGKPTDAQMNITAVYTVKNVNLYDLTLDDNYWNVRTPVNCLIKIEGSLTEPQITFDLDLPKADQRIVTQVKNLEEAEKTKQVLSLLILGKFQPLPGLAFDPNQLASNMSPADVLSNQLSNLLSNLGENLELGLNYEAREVALSYKLWNERVTIKTDVGFGTNNQQQPTPTTNTNQFLGDVEIEVKLNKKGNVRFKAFQKTNRNEFIDKGPYTQGIGFYIQKDFDHLFPKRKKLKNEKQNKK